MTHSKEFDKKEEKVDTHSAHAKHTSKQVTEKPNLSPNNDHVTKHNHSKDLKGKNNEFTVLMRKNEKTKLQLRHTILLENYSFIVTVPFSCTVNLFNILLW